LGSSAIEVSGDLINPSFNSLTTIGEESVSIFCPFNQQPKGFM
jgi:hypothetical protein